MSWLSRIFGGGGTSKGGTPPAAGAVEVYQGFRITPTPIREGGQFRISARIEKDVAGETKMHDLIRADTMADQTQAANASVAKAKQMIDEQGERIFR